MKTPKITVLPNQVLSFRHPVLRGDDGYGKVVRRSYAKKTAKEFGAILDSLQVLLERKPELASEIEAAEFDPDALEAYFGTAKEPPFLPDVIKFKGSPIVDAVIMGLQGRIQGLLAENNRLTLAMMEMQKAFGLKTETEKAITLRQALEHFKASFKATTAKTTDSVIFNAEEVLKAIGLDEKHVNVTLQTIQNVLAGLGIESVETRRKRAKGVKRFFGFIAMPANEGGINLGNPAANFKIKTVAALETNEEEQGEMLDPAAILKECTLGLDQRVLIALMGYAGLRLSEATGLAWNDVEWDRPQAKRLIYIRKNAGRQTLKTTGSRRPVKPLPALWPILEKYRAAATKEAKALPMMFYKDAATLETWIVFDGGQTSSPEMSAALTKIVKGKFAFESKLNLCLRHYWTTTMNSKVSKEMESIMGGHSKAIANKHYLNKVETIRGLDLGAAK